MWSLSPQSRQNSVFSGIFSGLGIKESNKESTPANMVAEAWLRCCFWPKSCEKAMRSELAVRCHTFHIQISTDMPTLPNNFSISTVPILHNFLHCFNVFFHRLLTGIVINILPVFTEKSTLLIKTLSFVQSKLGQCHSQHFKLVRALYLFIFHIKSNIDFFIHFFRKQKIVKQTITRPSFAPVNNELKMSNG